MRGTTKVRVTVALGGAMVLALGILGCALIAELNEKEVKVTLDQVPVAVKATLESEGGTIKEIEKEEEGGKVTYEAEVVKDGRETEVKVAEDGKVLKRKAEGKEHEKEEEEKEEHEVKVKLDQVPAAVQATFQAEGGKINEVEKQEEGGKTTYEAEIVKDGKKMDVKVDESGKVLERESDEGKKGDKDDDEKEEKEEKKEAEENAVKMTLDQVPPAVRATLEKESAGGKITALEQETEDGQRVFSADLLLGGKEGEVLVAPDGKVVKREGAAVKARKSKAAKAEK